MPFSSKQLVFGVTLNAKVTLDDHISGIMQACNYHLRSLRHKRPLVDLDTTNTIACSLACTRLEYCNAILYRVTKQNIGRLHRVQNSLARVVRLAPYRSSAPRLRHRLHWLPVRERITFKIARLTHKSPHPSTHHQPGYLSSSLSNIGRYIRYARRTTISSSYNGRRQSLLPGLSESQCQSYGTVLHFHCDVQQQFPASVANSRHTCLATHMTDHRLSKDRLTVLSLIQFSEGH